MNFRDIKDRNNESVHGIEINIADNKCHVRWAYPFGCSQIYVFEVPFDVCFNESDAERDVYKTHVMKYPDTHLVSDNVCNFAIFAVGNDGELIRQEKKLYLCPITVSYRITEEQESRIVGRKYFRKQVEVVTTSYLDICSDISVSGRKLLYRLKDRDGEYFEDMIFCLPVNLNAGIEQRLKLPYPIELFAAEDNIILKG